MDNCNGPNTLWPLYCLELFSKHCQAWKVQKALRKWRCREGHIILKATHNASNTNLITYQSTDVHGGGSTTYTTHKKRRIECPRRESKHQSRSTYYHVSAGWRRFSARWRRARLIFDRALLGSVSGRPLLLVPSWSGKICLSNHISVQKKRTRNDALIPPR